MSHSAPVIAWLRALGRQVPRDLGLVERELPPAQSCAGVLYAPARIGARAVETLVGLVHRNEKEVPVAANEILPKGQRREGRTLPPRR